MSRTVLGIDLGGTNTVLALVNPRGEILAGGQVKTCGHHDFAAFVNELLRETRRMVADSGAPYPAAVGVGAPAANIMTGTIERTANLPWEPPILLAAQIGEVFGVPVAVGNDANAAALGEMTYGAARGMRDFIMITLGTGVGSGVVCDGNLLSGREGMAGELGHIIIRRGGRSCGCGRNGCLETYTSARGVARTAVEMLNKDPERPSILRQVAPEDMTSLHVYQAAMASDSLALEVFEFTGKVLGEALADFAAFTSPKAFVLFGGLAQSGEMLLKPLKKAFEENLLFLHADGRIKILLSQLPQAQAAVLGASALAWQKLG
nr:ROK family protein [Bacteroides sp.]